MGGSGDLDTVIREVIGWLAQLNNTNWLLIFDNVDQEYSRHNIDPDIYNIKCYLSSTNYKAVLIIT